MDQTDTAEDSADRSAGEERVLDGLGVSPGITIGTAVLYGQATQPPAAREISDEAIAAEIELFEEALHRAEHDLNRVIAVAREKLGEDSVAIFEAQRMMLHDDELLRPVEQRIRERREPAALAVKEVMATHRQRLEAAETEYLRDRVHDLVDVQDRIIRHLRRGKLATDLEARSVVIAEKLSAADMIRFRQRGVPGCAGEHGGTTSHVAIIARALGIPTIFGVPNLTAHIPDGAPVILDGRRGRIIVLPTEATLKQYRRQQAAYQDAVQQEKELTSLPAATQDGHEVRLQANIEFTQELELVRRYGATGIGLVRTEMLFLMRREVSLSEELQYRTYCDILNAVRPHPTTFRMMDLGGDKMLPMAHREHNPFLGWRGIRVLLDRPELLRPQLRALLRASTHGPMRILLPMVTHLDEVEQFRALKADVEADLRATDEAFDPDVPVGIMAEVPAVALQAAQFAQSVDFFSIGTNDLTQYVLAIDRGNDLVARRFDALHPAVLQLIQRLTAAAREHDIAVSLCGKLGVDPEATPVLVGLGVDTLSGSPTFLPGVKRVVRALHYEEAVTLAQEVVAAPDAATVRQRISNWFADHAPEACPPRAFPQP